MKAKMLTVLTVSALLLTACGSDDNKPQVNNQTNPSNTPAANNNTPAPVQEWTFTTMNAQNDGTQFTKIKIGDREMEITPQANDTRLGQIAAHDNDSNGTMYARYGMVLDEQSKQAVVFYQGEPTSLAHMSELAQVPATFRYQGQSFAMLPDKANGSAAEWQGKSEFQVNFAEKTLTGALTDWKATKSNQKLNDMRFEGTISGNTFTSKDANLKAEGKFYGAGARDLAGAFQDKNSKAYGAFGATRGTANFSVPGVTGTGGGNAVGGVGSDGSSAASAGGGRGRN